MRFCAHATCGTGARRSGGLTAPRNVRFFLLRQLVQVVHQPVEAALQVPQPCLRLLFSRGQLVRRQPRVAGRQLVDQTHYFVVLLPVGEGFEVKFRNGELR